MKGASLTIVRRFRAPPDKVFAACTEPETMARWFGPSEWTVLDMRADVRVGRTFWFRMSGPAGVMAAEGHYETIDRPHRLVHTWQWTEGPPEYPPDGVTSRITYEFEPDGTGTRLTFTQEGLANDASADSHEHGWSDAIDKLLSLLDETGEPTAEPLAASRLPLPQAGDRLEVSLEPFDVTIDFLAIDRLRLHVRRGDNDGHREEIPFQIKPTGGDRFRLTFTEANGVAVAHDIDRARFRTRVTIAKPGGETVHLDGTITPSTSGDRP